MRRAVLASDRDRGSQQGDKRPPPSTSFRPVGRPFHLDDAEFPVLLPKRHEQGRVFRFVSGQVHGDHRDGIVDSYCCTALTPSDKRRTQRPTLTTTPAPTPQSTRLLQYETIALIHTSSIPLLDSTMTATNHTKKIFTISCIFLSEILIWHFLDIFDDINTFYIYSFITFWTSTLLMTAINIKNRENINKIISCIMIYSAFLFMAFMFISWSHNITGGNNVRPDLFLFKKNEHIEIGFRGYFAGYMQCIYLIIIYNTIKKHKN